MIVAEIQHALEIRSKQCRKRLDNIVHMYAIHIDVTVVAMPARRTEDGIQRAATGPVDPTQPQDHG